jgi:hypothetical protein
MICRYCEASGIHQANSVISPLGAPSRGLSPYRGSAHLST